jgi:hypothetical protein
MILTVSFLFSQQLLSFSYCYLEHGHRTAATELLRVRSQLSTSLQTCTQYAIRDPSPKNIQNQNVGLVLLTFIVQFVRS